MTEDEVNEWFRKYDLEMAVYESKTKIDFSKREGYMQT